MNDDLYRRHCREELAFFGRIGADVSHEMRNVLSIIGEYAGLLDDLTKLAKRGKELEPARLEGLAAKIAAQVGKGTEAMERFSRFAHAADEETTSFDLAALTANMVALGRRHVAMAGSTLEADIPDRPIPVRANAFRLQHAVFSAIELVREALEEGSPITIGLSTQGSAAVISLSGTAAAGSDVSSGRVAELRALVSELKGNVEMSHEHGKLSLRVVLSTR